MFLHRILSALRRPRSIETLVRASLLLIAVVTMGSAAAFYAYPQPVEANSLVRFHSAPQQVAAKPAGGVQIPPAPAPQNQNCVPASGSLLSTQPTQEGFTATVLPITYYRVSGNSVAQVARQLQICGPTDESGGRFAATTNYAIAWNFQYAETTPGLCSVSNVKVSLVMNQVLPSWQNTAVSPEWQAFVASLTSHEAGHVQIDQTGARRLLVTLQQLPDSSCSSFDQSANAAAQAQIASIKAANDAYDTATNHGATLHY